MAQVLGLCEEDLAQRLQPLWRPGELGHRALSEIERQTAAELDLETSSSNASPETSGRNTSGRSILSSPPTSKACVRGIGTTILSNSLVGARERDEAPYAFAGMCDVIIYSHEEGMAKPDPRFYELACARLACDPSRAVFVDDKPSCVAGARAAGLHPIHHRGNRTTIRALDTLLGR